MIVESLPFAETFLVAGATGSATKMSKVKARRPHEAQTKTESKT